MVDAEGGLLKIVDFGIARSLQTNVSRFTQGIGTPNYMAPEQFMGQMDHRSDIYAIGAVCYELLSYQQAVEGDSAFAVIGKIVLETPPPLADVCPGVDPAIIAIVNKALEKDPAQRYQDLEAMRADIKRVGGRRCTSPTTARAGDAPVAARVRHARGGDGHGRGRRRSRRSRSEPGGARAAGFAPEPSAAPSAAGSSTRIRRSVAVLGFKNLSGRADTAWLSTALGEMLTTELTPGEKLRTIPAKTWRG